ncbi:class IV adenylate cyclase [Candidatus Woesearchaeota archaeon]|nr:class IV adenylate cyclase [Candidatus Woesearchaeota archaeon]
MREIEVKILEIDRKELEKRLVSLGAKKVFDDKVDSMLFDFEDDPIHKSKGLFRLRKSGSKSTLTLKKHVKSEKAKVRDEYEVEVSDFEKMKQILKLLGFHCWQGFEKHRTSYVIDKVHFELDKLTGEYSYIPEFLEIEGPDVETIYKYVELLGFKKEDCKKWGGPKLIKYYKKKNKKT